MNQVLATFAGDRVAAWAGLGSWVVNLVKAAHPLRSRGDGCVGGRIEVAVQSTFRCVDDDGAGAITLSMRVVPCVEAVALDQLGSKLASKGKAGAGRSVKHHGFIVQGRRIYLQIDMRR